MLLSSSHVLWLTGNVFFGDRPLRFKTLAALDVDEVSELRSVKERHYFNFKLKNFLFLFVEQFNI